jgi:hypothetical protein
MAYIDREKKAKISAALKPILKQYNVSGTLSVHNNSSIVLTLRSGSIDFIANSNRVCGKDHYQLSRGFIPNTSGYSDVNTYHYKDHYDGEARRFLTAALSALKSADWYDSSDAQIDYFNTAYYVNIKIGRWDKPYVVVEK